MQIVLGVFIFQASLIFITFHFTLWYWKRVLRKWNKLRFSLGASPRQTDWLWGWFCPPTPHPHWFDRTEEMMFFATYIFKVFSSKSFARLWNPEKSKSNWFETSESSVLWNHKCWRSCHTILTAAVICMYITSSLIGYGINFNVCQPSSDQFL